jgi:hypothetical protein
MRKAVNLLAVVGALALLVVVTGWVRKDRGYVMIYGTVVDAQRRPIPHLSIFLDRGSNLIERYATDSLGRFELPLFPIEPHRATWLVCAPGAIPMIGKPDVANLGKTYFTYETSALGDTVFRFYRAGGWSGPIPRECPRGTESGGWRYPASAGKGPGAVSTTEPDWARYPGPPDLPEALHPAPWPTVPKDPR